MEIGDPPVDESSRRTSSLVEVVRAAQDETACAECLAPSASANEHLDRQQRFDEPSINL